MSLAVETAARAGGSETHRSPSRVVDGLSAVVAAAPFLVVGIVYGVSRHLVLGGDQSLIALDALDARHLDQFVGPYSRMGWAHPGPAWSYLLAPLYWAFGTTGAGLVAASMILEGVVAALVVVSAGTGRSWQRPLMAGLLLLYVLRMPSVLFVAVWNPFALLLPTVLLLLLAARACSGSAAAFAAELVVLSFLLQTHIGTLPLVGLVGLLSATALGVGLLRHEELRPQGRAWWRIGPGLAVAVLMWVPPLWQQLTAPPHEGNLRLLGGYFLHGSGGGQERHTWHEAVSAIGQMLGAPVYGWPANPAPLRTILTAAVVAAVGVQLLGGVVVAVLAHRTRDRQVSWLAIMTVVGTVAGLVAARTVTGPLENYLVLWVSVLPLVLLYAGVSLVIGAWRSASEGWMLRLASVLAVCGIAGAVVVGMSLNRSADTQLPDQPGAHEAAALALAALPPERSGQPPVLLDIPDVSVWTTSTEVALELERAGHRISVPRKWEYGFGWDRLSTGNEVWRLALVPMAPGQHAPAGSLGTVAAINGPDAVVLTRTRP